MLGTEIATWAVAAGLVALTALVLAMLVIAVTRSPAAGVWTVGVAHFVDTLFIGGFNLPLAVNTSPFDLALVVLAAACMLRARRLNWSDPIVRAWALTAMAWIGLFIVGSVQFKTRAGVEYRQFFYLSFGVAYFMSFDYTPERVRQIIRIALLFGLATLAIAVYRWGYELLVPGVHDWQERPGVLNWRVINAQQTFVLVLLALAGVAARMDRVGRGANQWIFSLPVLLIAVMLLQHRTNWVVFAVSLLILLALRASDMPGRSHVAAALLLMSIGVVSGLVLSSESSLGDAMRASTAEPFERRSTIAWRIDSWTEVVRSWAKGGPVVWVTGSPFGVGWYRYIESAGASGSFAEQSPHNFYVTVLGRGGLMGLAGLGASLLLAARRLVQMRRASVVDQVSGSTASFLVAVLIAHAAFFLTYAVVPFSVVFLGVALAVASRSVDATGEGPAVECRPSLIEEHMLPEAIDSAATVVPRRPL